MRSKMSAIQHSNLYIFLAEFAGTFILVAFATGVIVYDAQSGVDNGLWMAAAGPFAALVIGVYLFGKISRAHFNPAVTIAYYVTGHITRSQIKWYIAAEIAGAMAGSVLVAGAIGTDADIGANAPNPEFGAHVTFPVEVVASAMLMGVILYVVYTNGLRGFSGIAIGGIVGLDILMFGAISGASMNPARALGPALLSGAIYDMWLYLTAPFAGTVAVAVLYRLKFKK